MICMIEVDMIAIDETDGCVRTEGMGRGFFQKTAPDLEICVLLLFV